MPFTPLMGYGIIYSLQWSVEAESEAQEEGAKWVRRPPGNSGS